MKIFNSVNFNSVALILFEKIKKMIDFLISLVTYLGIFWDLLHINSTTRNFRGAERRRFQKFLHEKFQMGGHFLDFLRKTLESP